MTFYILNGVAILLAVSALWFLNKARQITFDKPPLEVSAKPGLSENIAGVNQREIEAIVDARLGEFVKERAAFISHSSAQSLAESSKRIQEIALLLTQSERTTEEVIKALWVDDVDVVSIASLPRVIGTRGRDGRVATPSETTQENPQRVPENPLVATQSWPNDVVTTRH